MTPPPYTTSYLTPLVVIGAGESLYNKSFKKNIKKTFKKKQNSYHGKECDRTGEDMNFLRIVEPCLAQSLYPKRLTVNSDTCPQVPTKCSLVPTNEHWDSNPEPFVQ